jgi:5-methylcytosine-specific restriction endonuclease McrA
MPSSGAGVTDLLALVKPTKETRPRRPIDTSALANPKASHRITAPRGSSKRPQVEARDHGICALCHLDTAALQEEFADATAVDEKKSIFECLRCDHRGSSSPCAECGERFVRRAHVQGARDVVRAKMRRHRFSKKFVADYSGGSLWAADHIVPLADDGPDEMENLRTLCLSCHSDVTADLRRRMSRDGRGRR